MFPKVSNNQRNFETTEKTQVFLDMKLECPLIRNLKINYNSDGLLHLFVILAMIVNPVQNEWKWVDVPALAGIQLTPAT